MAWLRIAFALCFALWAAYAGFIFWAFNGYVSEYGDTPADTLGFAIPWSIATVALMALIVAAAVSRRVRVQLSWLALLLAGTMGIAFLSRVWS